MHSRDVFTIWGALADAGGFYEVVSLTVFFMLSHYRNFFYI